MIIRAAQLSDAPEIAAIYNHYILGTVITFEETLVDGKEIELRITDLKDQDMPWYVAVDAAGNIIGYAYASKWKGRCAYRRSVAVTVYLSPEHTGKGAGSRLYEVLFGTLKSLGYHTVIGGISLPNAASIRLHEKFGMEKSAHFKEVGYKFARYVDVGYWQGILDVNCSL